MPETNESQIRATFDEFAGAWNAHDVDAMVACWSPQGTAVDIWGRYAMGHAGVAELLRGEHAGTMRDSRYRINALRLKPLSDHSVVAECDATIENAHAPNGHLYELHHRIDAVLVREDGRWRYISLHPSFDDARG